MHHGGKLSPPTSYKALNRAKKAEILGVKVDKKIKMESACGRHYPKVSNALKV